MFRLTIAYTYNSRRTEVHGYDCATLDAVNMLVNDACENGSNYTIVATLQMSNDGNASWHVVTDADNIILDDNGWRYVSWYERCYNAVAAFFGYVADTLVPTKFGIACTVIAATIVVESAVSLVWSVVKTPLRLALVFTLAAFSSFVNLLPVYTALWFVGLVGFALSIPLLTLFAELGAIYVLMIVFVNAFTVLMFEAAVIY